MKAISAIAGGAVVGAITFLVIGGVGVAVGGTAFGLGIGAFSAIGAGIGAIYYLGSISNYRK